MYKSNKKPLLNVLKLKEHEFILTLKFHTWSKEISRENGSKILYRWEQERTVAYISSASGGQMGKCPLNTLVMEATETCVKACISYTTERIVKRLIP